MSVQRGFFDIDERYAALSAAGDPQQRFAAVVDFGVFRPVLDAALARSDRAKGGRPPYDAVLQALYSLSDEQAEFQLRNRVSFTRFVGLELHDRCRMRRPSGSIASSSSAPVRSMICSDASMRS